MSPDVYVSSPETDPFCDSTIRERSEETGTGRRVDGSLSPEGVRRVGGGPTNTPEAPVSLLSCKEHVDEFR